MDGDQRTLGEILLARAHEAPTRVLHSFLDANGDVEDLTTAELAGWAAAIAVTLRERVTPGERALLLFPSGLDDVAALFGCLLAGVVAVPIYPPRIGTRYEDRDLRRTRSIVQSAAPAVVLTIGLIEDLAAPVLEHIPELATLPWISTDRLPVARDLALLDAHRLPDAGEVAYLQYTSGSTATPRGVVLTHRSITANLHMATDAVGLDPDDRIVSWLPLYHDMGLVGCVLLPVHVGYRSFIMSPDRFLTKPRTWPEAMSRFGATLGGGPNFAFELATRKTPPEVIEGLDLSRWDSAWNGAEPIRPDTLDRFAAAFAPAGFRREAFTPLYGLAEVTVFVAGSHRSEPPAERSVASADLAEGVVRVAEGDEPATTLIACGADVPDQQIAIVDPDTCTRLGEGVVGEVWLAGPHVGDGYWGDPDATAATFGAGLADDPDGSGTPWLRTGDLGFLDGGHLVVCGRRKDLIIVAGRNRYPHDLERTAEAAHEACRPGGAAAFAVEFGDERVVLVQEVRPGTSPEEHDAVVAAVRAAIAAEHELRVHEVVLVGPGDLPKTSSGKVQRSRARELWATGSLVAVEG